MSTLSGSASPVVNLALTERDVTFDGEFFPVQRPTTIATRPLQDQLPVWLGASSQASTAASTGRPAIAVSGTPDQVVSGLQQASDETGTRRLLVETFSREEAGLFAREVIPVLKQRNATTA